MPHRLSARARALTSSVIREILKVTERPEVISFAGGLPSPATFPVARVRDACERVLSEAPEAALQYGPTEGYRPLREWIAARHSKGAVRISPERVLVTTGSQQALDLLGKVLIDPASPVLVETPTYLGALQAFSLFEPEFRAIQSDDEGLVPEAIDPRSARGARFLYCLPNFQNPTGRRLPLARRERLARLAADTNLLVVEDDPYGELAYEGDALPTLLSLNSANVIHLGSFSKILAPGLRLGYLIAPEPMYSKLVQTKQAADLHTPSFTQRIAHEVLAGDFIDQHVQEIRKLYAAQCDAMLAALARHFPKEVSWTRPKGGMFIWVTLPDGIDSFRLLDEAIARNVAFVPGAPFYANAPRHNTFRLSFVTVPAQRIEEGVTRLGELLHEAVAAQMARA